MHFLLLLGVLALLLIHPVGRILLLLSAVGFGVLFYIVFYVQIPAQREGYGAPAAASAIDWSKPPYNGHAVTAPAPAKAQALPPAAIAMPPASPASSVEDLPWDPGSPELREPTAASQRLLHRLHQAQGVPG
jgi:hypothetical protein